jgi:small subunit ribosomal protein S6
MRRYETIFIVRPNIAEDEIAAITSKASSIIEGDGGTIIRINNWGLKKLAYLIKKENQGYYVYVDYGGIPASVAEMERIFRIDDRILKYLTVKLSDSCDPEAVKEQLASAETVATADETLATADETVATTDEKDAGKNESANTEEKKVD